MSGSLCRGSLWTVGPASFCYRPTNPGSGRIFRPRRKRRTGLAILSIGGRPGSSVSWPNRWQVSRFCLLADRRGIRFLPGPLEAMKPGPPLSGFSFIGAPGCSCRFGGRSGSAAPWRPSPVTLPVRVALSPVALPVPLMPFEAAATTCQAARRILKRRKDATASRAAALYGVRVQLGPSDVCPHNPRFT